MGFIGNLLNNNSAMYIIAISLLIAALMVLRKPGRQHIFPAPILKDLPDDVLLRKGQYFALPRKALVTGGTGFVGRRLVQMLTESGCEVTVFDKVKGNDCKKARYVTGDLLIRADVDRAVQGIEVIYHVAAPHASHPPKVQYNINVLGTRDLLQAAQAAGVKKFVFTSSASVVFEGRDQAGVSETASIPTTGLDYYTRTKAEAEAMVLKANSRGGTGMLTAAIRPHGIFGPGDRQFFPVLIENARKAKTKYQIGHGQNLADFTYVGNVAHAHLLAASQLGRDPKVAGQAFFITNDAPLRFWTFLATILTGFGYDAPSVTLPGGVMAGIGGILEQLAHLLARFGFAFQPTFTRSRVQYMTKHHWYDISKAKRLLGYKPLWTQKEAIEICFAEMRELRNPLAPKPNRASDVVDGSLPRYSRAQIARHNRRDDAWIVVEDKVYDVTEYVDIHPGDDAILKYVGGDSTAGFKGPQHPSTAWDVIRNYMIGEIAD